MSFSVHSGSHPSKVKEDQVVRLKTEYLKERRRRLPVQVNPEVEGLRKKAKEKSEC